MHQSGSGASSSGDLVRPLSDGRNEDGRARGSIAWQLLFTLVSLLLLSLLEPQPARARAGGDGRAPFASGEKLVFDIDWYPPWFLFFLPPMNAGEAEVSLSDEFDYNGSKAVKILFTARSSGTFAKLAGIKVDDRYEFISNPDTFCTYKAFKQERDGKRTRDIEIVYRPEAHRLHIRELDLAVTPPKIKRDEDRTDIPDCVQDWFSAVYSIRRKEFFAGANYKMKIGDNDTVKEVEARIEKSEQVQTPAGNFKAWKVNTVSILGGLFKGGGQLKVWLSADEKKLPVQIYVKVELGTVSIKLKSSHYQGRE
jgi:hypothetical protein